jgi:hypothetical protein
MSLFLNLPGEKSGRTGFFKNKGRWMIVVLLFPEMITALAAEQWRSARQSVEDFKTLQEQWQFQADDTVIPLHDESGNLLENLARIKKSPWSMRHAFFADMGGVILGCPDFPPFPVTAYQINRLVTKRHLSYPRISRTTIWDKNKADGFARLLTTLQMIWFLVQIVGRAIQRLAVTTLELSTLSFIFCTINTLFFWTHKPLDVEEPIHLECNTPLESILAEAQRSLADGFDISPLEYMNPPISRTSMVAPFWVGFEVTFAKRKNKPPATEHTVKKRLSNIRTIPPRGLIKRDIIYGTFFVFAYFGIHLVAWRFAFPSRTERLLWRVATFILMGLSAVYFLAVMVSNYLAPYFARRFLKVSDTDFHAPIELAHKLPHWLAVLIHVPFFLAYALARLYIIVEGFCHLRALAETAYSTIKWENFLPHMA